MQCQHGIHVVAVGFGLAHGDIDMMPREGRGSDTNALFHSFVTQVGTPVPGGDDGMDLEVIGAQPHALGTVKTHRPDIGGIQIVLPDHRFVGGIQGGFFERDIHTKNAGRTVKPIGMRLEPEDRRAFLSMVRTQAFEHAHTVMQGVGQNMHLGFAPGNHFAVKPDDAVSIGHRHAVFLLQLGAGVNPAWMHKRTILFKRSNFVLFAFQPALPDRQHLATFVNKP